MVFFFLLQIFLFYFLFLFNLGLEHSILGVKCKVLQLDGGLVGLVPTADFSADSALKMLTNTD